MPIIWIFESILHFPIKCVIYYVSTRFAIVLLYLRNQNMATRQRTSRRPSPSPGTSLFILPNLIHSVGFVPISPLLQLNRIAILQLINSANQIDCPPKWASRSPHKSRTSRWSSSSPFLPFVVRYRVTIFYQHTRNQIDTT